jgi:uncharacterized protein YkwD
MQRDEVFIVIFSMLAITVMSVYVISPNGIPNIHNPLDYGPEVDPPDRVTISSNSSSNQGGGRGGSSLFNATEEDREVAEPDQKVLENEIVEYVNRQRRKLDVGVLESDKELYNIARNHSIGMAENDYIGLKTPDGEPILSRYEKREYGCYISINETMYSPGGAYVFLGIYGADSPIETQPDNEEEWVESKMSNLYSESDKIYDDYWENIGVGVRTVKKDGVYEVYVTIALC